MPRPQSQTRQDLLTNAMMAFWKGGYRAVSVGDLVRETGVSRGSLYSDYSGKEALFSAVLDHYQTHVVTPLFGAVEAPDAGLEAIASYLSAAIAQEGRANDGVTGCLVCSTWGQISTEEADIKAKLLAHADRLTAGFTAALTRENTKAGNPLSTEELEALGHYTMTAVQGLWSYARLAPRRDQLQKAADQLIAHLRRCLYGAAS
ncbi:TetR/AcrR family transcriptional regulator [Shimia sp.]|uniref:TetR/AcrR family transcriptional regulator n=1 Tax=Shimia sp. TaxID=1954381 RepID=UPI003BAABF78